MQLHSDNNPSRTRYRILLLLFINVVINYMDRTNISIAGAALSRDLQLNTVQLGYVFSGFGWTYAALQIPGGILADRFGPRILYSFTLIIWSCVTLGQGFVTGFFGLLGLRIAVGAFEAPSYPTNNRVVTSWFPPNERASAIAVYTSGQFIGLAFLTPALVAVQFYFGWRGLFVITGVIGIIWGVIWFFLYRDPEKHSKINEPELEKIPLNERRAELMAQTSNRKRHNWKDLETVFTDRRLWGIYVGQFAVGSTLWFFLTWFPTYLVKFRGINFLQSGLLASIPFLAAFVGILLSGFLSDLMVRKGLSVGFARKAPIIAGLLLSTIILGANFVQSPSLIVLFMALAFFGNGMASISWVFVSTLAPKHLIGLTGGVFNFMGGLASILVPIGIGYLARGGNFAPALIFISVVGLVGALSYVFLVGNVPATKLH